MKETKKKSRRRRRRRRRRRICIFFFTEGIDQRTIRIPVDKRNVDNVVVWMNITDEKVRVRVSGTRGTEVAFFFNQ